LVLLVACGAASKPPEAPKAPAAPAAPKAPAAGAPAVAPTVVAAAAKIISARDSITLVLPEEPIQLNSFLSLGASLTSPVTKDNLVEPLTWQSGDDQRIVPTGATESWQQVDADTWRFQLRQGVKFHNGEAWNAQAALSSLAFLGIGANNNSSYPYTGGFKAEAVGEYGIDINCDQPCPIFANTAFFVLFEAPGYLAANPKDENRARQAVGFGPYKLVKWEPGVSITQEAYAGYVPAGNHIEFQKPLIRNLKWVWRGETTVMSAMVKTNEADIAWDVGVDQVKALPKEWVKSGSSAETFAMTVNTVWHPELKKKNVRLAIMHAINCKEMIDALYSGQSQCRGNVIWPGVIGATERNTAPYKYDPVLARQLLKDANYDPKNVIRIVGRSTRIPKQVEVYEAIQGYMKAVGMNVEINIVEAKTRADLTNCGIGLALNEVLQAQGKDPKKDKPTLADMKAAVDKGGANCPTGMLIENEPSNETLDFGRQMNFYMNCVFPRSLVCDPSPGGIQEQIAPALAASGAERQRLMSILADKLHDDVLFISGFDLPVIYAVNPKLNWKTRFDGRVRAQTMWFSK
jgi:peptide/nickel transport system substrate-binding protein